MIDNEGQGERVLKGQSCVDEGAEYLARLDPRWKDLLEKTGPLPHRLRQGGFLGLFQILVGQQLSIHAARAVWNRLEAAGVTSATGVVATSDDQLRSLGLSRQKVRAAKELAAADLPFSKMNEMPLNQVMAMLMAQRGVGRWTAEIYMMFCLGRADVFAPGDLALKESARIVFDLEGRPSDREFTAMAEPWRPWRSVAARALWEYYRLDKGREGVT